VDIASRRAGQSITIDPGAFNVHVDRGAELVLADRYLSRGGALTPPTR
jgi:hypothetical protein